MIKQVLPSIKLKVSVYQYHSCGQHNTEYIWYSKLHLKSTQIKFTVQYPIIMLLTLLCYNETVHVIIIIPDVVVTVAFYL